MGALRDQFTEAQMSPKGLLIYAKSPYHLLRAEYYPDVAIADAFRGLDALRMNDRAGDSVNTQWSGQTQLDADSAVDKALVRDSLQRAVAEGSRGHGGAACSSR
jgi:hypothetical protein